MLHPRVLAACRSSAVAEVTANETVPTLAATGVSTKMVEDPSTASTSMSCRKVTTVARSPIRLDGIEARMLTFDPGWTNPVTVSSRVHGMDIMPYPSGGAMAADFDTSLGLNESPFRMVRTTRLSARSSKLPTNTWGAPAAGTSLTSTYSWIVSFLSQVPTGRSFAATSTGTVSSDLVLLPALICEVSTAATRPHATATATRIMFFCFIAAPLQVYAIRLRCGPLAPSERLAACAASRGGVTPTPAGCRQQLAGFQPSPR